MKHLPSRCILLWFAAAAAASLAALRIMGRFCAYDCIAPLFAPPYANSSSLDGLLPPPPITLASLFANLTPTTYPSAFPRFSAQTNLTTSFFPNPNQYINLAARNVCMQPGGRLLVVGVSESDIAAKYLSQIPSLHYLWSRIYSSCGNATHTGCTGVVFSQSAAAAASVDEVTWIPGNTLHFVPYAGGNTMHNFAERVWPRLAASVAPLNESTPGLPVHRLLIHRLENLLLESSTRVDRDQVLWQARMLMEIWPGSSLLKVDGFADILCFETLLLQMDNSDRMDETRLPTEISGPALRKYKAAVFRFLGQPMPEVPPRERPLRLLYYGRSDSSRRRVLNNEEVLHYLKHNLVIKNMEIRSLDELLKAKKADYTFPSVVSLFSQTDILVVAHGAFTWAAIFMPEGAAIVEIFGPCDFSKARVNYSVLTDMHTWIRPISDALHLKHDISNPFRDAIPNPRRGNTTLCKDPFDGVPDYTVDPPKVGIIINSLGRSHSPTTHRLTSHWP